MAITIVSESQLRELVHIDAAALEAVAEGFTGLATREAVARADLVVCDRKSQVFRLGELHHARDAGLIGEDGEIYELGQLTAGQHPGRRDDAQITLADLTGVGVQDVAISLFALQKVEEQGIGFRIED